MKLQLDSYPYLSRRMPIFADRGIVATSQPLAAQAGLTMLQSGGNAVDAALATAIALTVLEPTSNGIGSDAFALVWDGGTLHGLNGSGRSAAATRVEALRSAGHEALPAFGWWPVTVPGAPRVWADLHARFGRLPFEQLFEPAIHYADRGYLVSPVIATNWARAAEHYAAFPGPEFRPWFDTFAPGGRPPAIGERWSSAGHAATLRRIAASRSADFYEGDLATAIERFAVETGGPLRAADLAAHTSQWVDPIRVSYRDHDVWEIPPNGHGIAALMALNILDGLKPAAHPRDSVESFHLQIEAMKLAYADARRYVADPDHEAVPIAGLLDPGYAASRRELIGDQAIDPVAGTPPTGGTVYLCAVDGDGLMISYIQSNYLGFGSGVVVPNTGIALQNRGYNFTLEAGHPNRLAPRKRPYHTIIPGFLTRAGRAIGPFGVMGGFMQPQGHVQMMVNTLDYAMNPQASLDAPRWQWTGGRDVLVEQDTDPRIVAGLRDRGHQVQVSAGLGDGFGRGQLIWRLPGGGYVAGSDKRSDGCAVGF